MNHHIFILAISFLSFLRTENCCVELEIATSNCDGVGCYIPQCTENCEWESMQCWSSVGYCWCVDEVGNEIDDTSMPSWQGFPDCQEIDSLNCENGFTQINNLCFHEGDIEVIQKMIDNSYQSEIDLGCQEEDIFCGSPNPYMDALDSWFWVTVDGVTYDWTGNNNGVVEPLELGIQEWQNGRLKSLMCGAYIYCQLSGPIPEEINSLTEATTIRLEYNYLSGFIPDSICDLATDHSDYLLFDLTGNYLCPPYPECIDVSDFWYQDTSVCSNIGDVNSDSIINILDIILIVSFIINDNSVDYQTLIISDYNMDRNLDILDIIELVNLILN